jgi:malate dehydrogenase (oxaloacetate-decarboxylating)(NADP+)
MFDCSGYTRPCLSSSNILEVEIQTAARVAKLVFDSGLARVGRPADMMGFIRQHVYKPEYKKLV